jgi:hypothetical protein
MAVSRPLMSIGRRDTSGAAGGRLGFVCWHGSPKHLNYDDADAAEQV